MKILLLSDGICLTTGFGTVARRVAIELVRRGHQVSQLAAHDLAPFADSRPYHELGVRPYFPSAADVLGRDCIRRVLDDADPELVLFVCDPGSVFDWRQTQLGAYLDRGLPYAIYAPIEGKPIAEEYADPFITATKAMTVTAWGAAELQKEYDLTIPWAHHGVDHTAFHPLSREDRRRVRQHLGWDGKFVVSYVARNAGRKNHDRLLQALAILKRDLDDNVLLYLHCLPFEGYTLGGWNLIRMAKWLGINNWVQFPVFGRSEQGEPTESLAMKLAASDLYVHPAGVEGFGIPILEAMASGLPVVIPSDDGNMVEVAGSAAYAHIRPYDYVSHFSGATLALLHPAHIAETIANAREDQDRLKQAGERARTRSLGFDWQTMADKVADLCEAAPAEKAAEQEVVAV